MTKAELVGEENLKKADTGPARPFAWLQPNRFPKPQKRDFLTVVSGLPRSGTSLMMQILDQSGFSALADDARVADESNPKGYFELEAVKRLRTESPDWLRESEGKSVKVIAQLLRFLPLPGDYRVIFMQRPLDEVVRSQQKMLKSLGRKGGEMSISRMQTAYHGQLLLISAWLHKQNIPVQIINYHDCLTKPKAVAANLTHFLGELISTQQVASRVDPSLYRNR